MADPGMSEAVLPSTSATLAAGLRGRCPRCRRGRLFSGFLKITDQCPVCGLNFSGNDAGDGPAVAAIFILGFGVTGVAGLVEYLYAPMRPCGCP